jgi:hypothetical protein
MCTPLKNKYWSSVLRPVPGEIQVPHDSQAQIAMPNWAQSLRSLKSLRNLKSGVLLGILGLASLIPQKTYALCPQLADTSLTVAVMKFQNRASIDPNLVHSLPDMISTGLVQQSQARIVERSQVGSAAEALKVEASNLSPVQRAEMARWTGAQSLLLGTLTPLGRRTRLDLRLVDIKSGEVMCASASSADPYEVDSLISRALWNLRAFEMQTPKNANLTPSPETATGSNKDTDSSEVIVQFKVVNSLFNESPIPVQRLRVWEQQQLLAESEAFGKLNTDLQVLRFKLPPGTHLLRLELGAVNAKRQWKQSLDDQPEWMSLQIPPKQSSRIECLQIFSESQVQYRCKY